MPPNEVLLSRSEQELEAERFFYRHFTERGLSINLYDSAGRRQINPVLPREVSPFPNLMTMPPDAAEGVAFLAVDDTLFFLYDRIEHWSGAPGHLAFVALKVEAECLCELTRSDLPGTELSKSEYVLLSLLLSGHSLKSAAEQIGASYDTKRKQVQNVLEKFGADSQTSLLRKLSLELAASLLDQIRPAQGQSREFTKVFSQFGNDVVVSNITIGNGIEVPVWEFGARQGRPVLYFHNMLSPIVFSEDLVAALRENGLRWLVVPRHFLGRDMPFETGIRMERLTHALARTIDVLTDDPVICLGDSAGVSWAIHFARHHPQKVAHLVLSAVPTPAPPKPNSQYNTLYSEVAGMLRDNPLTLAGLARLYNALARIPLLARRGLRHMYRHSEADSATLEALFERGHIFEWLQLIANLGTHSSIDELGALQRNWRADLERLDCPVTCIQGVEDPISPVGGIEDLCARLPAVAFHPVANAGHFVLAQAFPDIALYLGQRQSLSARSFTRTIGAVM